MQLLIQEISLDQEKIEGKKIKGMVKHVENRFVVQLLSYVWVFATPWTATHWASLCLSISWSMLKVRSIELVVPSPISSSVILLPLPSVSSSIRVFSNELALCIRWPKCWSFSTSPSNEYQDWFLLGLTGLISLSVQGNLKSLIQHHSPKASILQHSAFFMVQFSHPYMTTGETIALTRQTFIRP